MARNDCVVCWYKKGALVKESLEMPAAWARMEAITHSIDLDHDVEVTIYRSGRALRDWHRVSAGELMRREREICGTN
jgi:hypothetical protein